jgi:hypothetical protein
MQKIDSDSRSHCAWMGMRAERVGPPERLTDRQRQSQPRRARWLATPRLSIAALTMCQGARARAPSRSAPGLRMLMHSSVCIAMLAVLMLPKCQQRCCRSLSFLCFLIWHLDT